MSSKIVVFDPTRHDTLSKVRGIGRYLQVLKENFANKFVFTSKIENNDRQSGSVFINPFFNFLSTPLLMKRVAKKQIAVIHDLIPLKYPAHFPIGIKGNINVFLNKLSLKNYDEIITDSEASKKDIATMLGLPENKIKVIYPCLPTMFTNPKSNPPTRGSYSKYCLYVGDATWNKNLVNIAKAIKILNVTCIFVGKVFENQKRSILRNPWQRELKQFLEEVKDDKRFTLKGFIPDKELVSLYQHARMNLLISRDEGFGFSFFEAASQRCPSILSDISVLHEIAGDAAVFANSNDPNEIANAIGELYWNNEKRDSVGIRASEKIGIVSAAQFRKKFLDAIK